MGGTFIITLGSQLVKEGERDKLLVASQKSQQLIVYTPELRKRSRVLRKHCLYLER